MCLWTSFRSASVIGFRCWRRRGRAASGAAAKRQMAAWARGASDSRRSAHQSAASRLPGRSTETRQPGQVPDEDRVVSTGRGQAPMVGTEGEAPHLTPLSTQGVDFFPRRGFPEMNHLLIRRGKDPAVRREGQWLVTGRGTTRIAPAANDLTGFGSAQHDPVWDFLPAPTGVQDCRSPCTLARDSQAPPGCSILIRHRPATDDKPNGSRGGHRLQAQENNSLPVAISYPATHQPTTNSV